ncbi:hypothetical protein [Anabaena sp. CS-542/02]|uniref:hypothetical protein n=1 Tax=Anabaena sp. CS-542/02 TaxID=3021719 RepID=UPI00232EF8AB|nr:hypothetical protein [Anabaena sp. CS-542/02]
MYPDLVILPVIEHLMAVAAVVERLVYVRVEGKNQILILKSLGGKIKSALRSRK